MKIRRRDGDRNQNASYDIGKAGIKYITFGDYFSSGEIRGDTDSYLESQVLWLEEFDRFVCGAFPEAKGINIGLPSLFFHNIKYLVDCVVLTSRIISRFIEMAKPSKIWYMPEIYGEDKIKRWNWFNFGKSSFYRLTPLICEKNNIPFKELNFEYGSDYPAAGDEEGSAGSAQRSILLKKSLLAGLRDIKRWLLRYRCLFNSSTLSGDEKVVNVFQEIITEKGSPFEEKYLLEEFKKSDLFKENTLILTDDVLLAYLHLATKIKENCFNEWGIAKWPTITPKRMTDKVYLVLKRAEEPLHFTEITKRINNVKFDDKVAYPATIHNELILDKKYVLVGRGNYALTEWGYKPGVVSDVIEEILKEENKLLTREEIIERVSQARIVKRSTVILALMNKNKFKKTSKGYILNS